MVLLEKLCNITLDQENHIFSLLWLIEGFVKAT